MIEYEKITSAVQFEVNSVYHVLLETYGKLLKSINLIKMNNRQKYIGQNCTKLFNLMFLITIIITLTISSGCQTSSQDENPIAGVDASGFWFGEFKDNTTGKILLNLTQEQSDISGTIALYEDMPGSFNLGFPVDGFVDDNEITMEDIDPSSDLKVSGQIQGNAIQNGEITISGNGTTATATFTATRYPTTNVKVLEKFKAPGKYPNMIGSDGNSLWIFDAYDASFIQTEYNGEIIKSLQLSEGCSGIAFENNSILINTGGQELYWYSKQNGVLLSKLRLDIYGRSIACDNDNLYTIGGYSGDLITFNRSGKMISQKEIIRYNSTMTSNGEFLWILQSFMPIILKYNKTGDLIHTYYIPEFGYYSETKTVGVIPIGVTFDGTYLWALAEEVPENFNDPRIINIYKLSMNP